MRTGWCFELDRFFVQSIEILWQSLLGGLHFWQRAIGQVSLTLSRAAFEVDDETGKARQGQLRTGRSAAVESFGGAHGSIAELYVLRPSHHYGPPQEGGVIWHNRNNSINQLLLPVLFLLTQFAPIPRSIHRTCSTNNRASNALINLIVPIVGKQESIFYYLNDYSASSSSSSCQLFHLLLLFSLRSPLLSTQCPSHILRPSPHSSSSSNIGIFHSLDHQISFQSTRWLRMPLPLPRRPRRSLLAMNQSGRGSANSSPSASSRCLTISQEVETAPTASSSRRSS